MKIPSIKKIIITTAFIGVFGLVFYNTKDLFFGSNFSVQTAQNGSTVSNAFLPISGKTKHTTTIDINGRTIAMDKNGNFSDGVILSPGYNIVEIIQRDRFGKERQKTIQLVAEPSSSVATAMKINY
ncbi:MAG: hypothetical protein KBC11_02200 [Candidatus Pacebacteria bacterium]|nr:hypothetical protein [Candidatus Paceibacterota bacterium]